MDKIKGISKAHTIYKTEKGIRVPGATTITGLLNKPYLVAWANKLGLEGVDSTKYRDEAADVGTLAHAMIQAHLQGFEIDMNEYSPITIDLATNAVLSYLEWEKGHTIKPILCETPLVSELNMYGGTVDCYCELDGKKVLLDFKTSKTIYDEYFVQLAGYAELLKEKGYVVDECHILRVGRDETEGFEERTVKDWRKYFVIFFNLLEIYYVRKELRWNV